DKKISTLAERQVENKRKLDNNNQAHQQSPKRQNVAQAYAAGTGERKEYAEGTGARGLVHALGGGEADQDLNDMKDDISA
ncbi:hypothetical protein Tco_1076853, partial [Tanacetum coccineum]